MHWNLRMTPHLTHRISYSSALESIAIFLLVCSSSLVDWLSSDA